MKWMILLVKNPENKSIRKIQKNKIKINKCFKCLFIFKIFKTFKMDMEDFFIDKKNKNPDKDKKIEDYIHTILEKKVKDKKELDLLIKELNRKHRISVSYIQLLYTYRKLCEKGLYKQDKKYIHMFQSKGFRSNSGVLVVAVFTSPYPQKIDIDEKGNEIIEKQEFSCEFDCYYCPKEPNQPRSYLLQEPGVLRANANHFDPISQFRDRIRTYILMGHTIDKIELLVLGGTWSSYPSDYQDRFIRDLFYAANTLYEYREKMSLLEEQKINEQADCKIIGLTLETRPDKITKRELINFRRLGVTRIQMGFQHTDDRVLYRVNRGCSVNMAKRAIKIAKDCCFKIDGHFMPDLPTPLKKGVSNQKEIFEKEDIDNDIDMYELDNKMIEDICYQDEWQVDQWKIYPCSVVPWTRIEDEYKRGVYQPYGGDKENKLYDLLIKLMEIVPPWVRLNRIIRDIPNQYIMGGNDNTSMRQDLDREMKKRGLYCMDIRNREVKNKDIDSSLSVLKMRVYHASEGIECFLSYETEDEKILFGFLRLRFPSDKEENSIFPELEGCSLIRELHVYGQVKKVGDKDDNHKHQHKGMGTKLLEKAFEISIEHGYKKIAVISGVGVKNYYRRFGFEDEEYFMTKKL